MATELENSSVDNLDVPLISRRSALTRGAAGLLGASSLSAVLAACGSSSSSSSGSGSSPVKGDGGSMTGTMVLLTYPGWYGPHELKDFEAQHKGVTVKTEESGESGAAATLSEIEHNEGAFDLALGGVPGAAQLDAAQQIIIPTEAQVPNLKLIPETFKKGFKYGIPTDYGKTGFAYRKDLISERPTSWADLFELAPKYSGKITMLKYDSDIQGTFLKALGYSINTKSQTELAAMQKKMLAFKPYLQAILETDYSKPLIEGTAVLAIDYDYDVAAAQAKNDNIVWVAPTEGMAAYVEGWYAFKSSKHLDLVWDLMNFHLEPKNYASFINYAGPAYVEPAAEKDIKKRIIDDPALKYDAKELKGVQFEGYLGPEQANYRAKLWEEFLNA
jgi:spermidine/putrescine transport system substrate-binding protein